MDLSNYERQFVPFGVKCEGCKFFNETELMLQDISGFPLYANVCGKPSLVYSPVTSGRSEVFELCHVKNRNGDCKDFEENE